MIQKVGLNSINSVNFKADNKKEDNSLKNKINKKVIVYSSIGAAAALGGLAILSYKGLLGNKIQNSAVSAVDKVKSLFKKSPVDDFDNVVNKTTPQAPIEKINPQNLSLEEITKQAQQMYNETVLLREEMAKLNGGDRSMAALYEHFLENEGNSVGNGYLRSFLVRGKRLKEIIPQFKELQAKLNAMPENPYKFELPEDLHVYEELVKVYENLKLKYPEIGSKY